MKLQGLEGETEPDEGGVREASMWAAGQDEAGEGRLRNVGWRGTKPDGFRRGKTVMTVED